MKSYINPLPDESLYSIISRYALIHGFKTHYQLKSFLLKEVELKTHFSSNDAIHLVKALSEITNKPIDRFSNEHTLLNLYRPFSYVNCKQSKSRFINSAFDVKGNFFSLRLCEECYKNDINKYGVAYWHRSHSVPNIDYCYIHRQRLLTRRVSDLGNFSKLLIPAIDKIERGYNHNTNMWDGYLIKESEACYALLNSDSRHIGIEELISYFIYDLENRNFIKDCDEVLTNNLKMQTFYISKNNFSEKCFKASLQRLLDFLYAKKNRVKSNIEFITNYSEHIYKNYGSFNNLFDLCREFTKSKDYERYASKIRHAREINIKNKISNIYSINTIFDTY